jgi:hypothetical protein
MSRASWLLSLIALSACILGRPLWHRAPFPSRAGPLTPAVDSITQAARTAGSNLNCDGHSYSPRLGDLRGCWAEIGDTLVFFLVDRSGQAVVASRHWTESVETALATTDSLRRVLDQRYGPGRQCDSQRGEDDRRIWQSDQRWATPNGQVMLLSGVRDGTSPRGSIQVQESLEPPDCRIRHVGPMDN